VIRYADIAVAVFVGLVALLLVLPVPAYLIDVLVVFNIGVAILLLLAGLYVSSSVSLLAFPTILLLTTLLRLSVNVASTRLILTNGYAGQVIESFGQFLIRGEVVVGLLLFLIVSVVTLIVIARGAGRVSEVAARFTLDALPGRQLAIDAELRAGTITPEQAKNKREELRRESMLYGSMDGAMKFVQGDAIAGLIIIFINIFGGLYLGISRGMELTDAIQTYTILTVGDGLVSQIPALLVSICAGIVVTRVSIPGGDTIAQEISEQFLKTPSTLFLTGILLFLLGVLPGLPFLPFFLLAGVFIGLGAYRLKSIEPELTTMRTTLLPEPEMEESGMVLYLDGLFSPERELVRFWDKLAQAVFDERGVSIPRLSIRQKSLQNFLGCELEINGTLVWRKTVPVRGLCVVSNPANAELIGCPVLVHDLFPVSGQTVFWTPDTILSRRVLQVASIPFYTEAEYLMLHAVCFLLSNPEEFFSMADVHDLLQMLEKRSPGLLSEGFQGNFLSVGKLTDVICALIRHGISVRDFRSIVEETHKYCAINGITASDDADISISAVVDHLRLRRKRAILERYKDSSGRIRLCLVSSDGESSLEEKLLLEREKAVGLSAIVCEHELKDELISLYPELHLRTISVEELENKVVPIYDVGLYTKR
jgi:type III secretion protein V